MADKKVSVVVEIPENFTPCTENFQENRNCPFSCSSYNEDGYDEISCAYCITDCPMQNMKPVD